MIEEQRNKLRDIFYQEYDRKGVSSGIEVLLDEVGKMFPVLQDIKDTTEPYMPDLRKLFPFTPHHP